MNMNSCMPKYTTALVTNKQTKLAGIKPPSQTHQLIEAEPRRVQRTIMVRATIRTTLPMRTPNWINGRRIVLQCSQLAGLTSGKSGPKGAFDRPAAHKDHGEECGTHKDVDVFGQEKEAHFMEEYSVCQPPIRSASARSNGARLASASMQM